MSRRVLSLALSAAVLAAPVAANAQRGGGGFHGGGFHGAAFGGGFHGGGYGGYHGYHGGYGGWHGGYGWRGGYWGGWGWGGFGLGLGLGTLLAYDYAPYYYYPTGYWGYPGYSYDDGDGEGYAPGAYSPAPNGADAWNQEQATEQGPPPASGANAAPCGHWVWRADQSRYQWDSSSC